MDLLKELTIIFITSTIVSVQFSFSSDTKLYPTLCNPMDFSMPGLPVHHQLPEFTQTHVHWVGSVIPFSSCLQSFPASGSFQMSQFFTLGGQSIEGSASISVLPMNIQAWFPSGWTGWISLQSKGRSRVFSKTTVQKHQFFGTQLSLWSNFHIHTWPLENLIEKFFSFAATTCSLQDLSSSIRDQPLALAAKAHSPNHWTATEFLYSAHSYGHTHMPPFSIGNEPLSLGITNNSENRLIEGFPQYW